MQNCNGWTNYETWKTNLELVDYDYFKDFGYEDARELATFIEEEVEELTFSEIPDTCFAFNTLSFFFAEVNWLEIAEHIIEESNS